MFSIHIDRLRQGHPEKIELEVSSDFIDVKEDELSFPFPVLIKGEAMMVDEEVIIRLQIQTKAHMDCSICNKSIDIDIDIPDFVHTIFSTELSESHYDYGCVVREEILLQIPTFAECGGSCPERANIDPYLKKPTPEVFPFADL